MINIFDTFLNGNESAFVEQSWENNFVSISHKNCIQGKHTPEKQDANGCHFGFSKKLFEFIVELFKEPKDVLKPPTDKEQIPTINEETENKDAIEYEIVDTPEPSDTVSV